MDKPEPSAAADQAANPNHGNDLPPGNHALEVAARRGIGPLSPLGAELWHGDARPCVSCGQLVVRDAAECDYCGQDLSLEMLEKMRAHAGPWYVLEHVRPFPGISLDRIIRQIRRGLITETSIVRGPSSDYQWRYAGETPGLCRYFSRCWNCHEKVSPSDGYCQECESYLSFEKPRVSHDPVTVPPAEVPADTAPQTGEVRPASGRAAAGLRDAALTAPEHLIRELSVVVDRTDLPVHEPVWDEPPHIAGIRATWVVAAALVVFIIALIILS